VILVPAMKNEAWNKSRSNVQNLPQWKPYWQNFQPRKFLSPQQYVQLLDLSGLHPLRVEVVPTVDPFVDRNELLDWLWGTFAPVIPAEKRREFYSDWIDEYLRLYPQAISNDGVISAELGYVVIEAVLRLK